MATEQTAEAEQAAPKGGMMGKLVIAAFMGVVILTECMLAYFWIPSSKDLSNEVQAMMLKRLEDEMRVDNTLDAIPQGEFQEFELGEFSITSHHGATDTSLRVDFTLAGTVLTKDLEKIEKLFEQHEHRFRDQVLVQIRNSNRDDLTDATLGLIKREILEKSNKLFGEPVLKQIIFSKYSHVEQ